MRKKIIAGNWKMNQTPKEAEKFIRDCKEKVKSDKADVVFCVPFVDLAAALDLLKNTGIAVGAQNMHFEDKGAFTGEISGKMLAEMGVQYVINGHSERRQYYAETDQAVNMKVKKALADALIPIVCVGESLEQRKQGVTVDFVRMQVKIAFKDIPAGSARKAVIAYEPIWAIGTGETATSEQAEEVCAAIRQTIAEMYGRETAEVLRVQYGGSVNAESAAELFAMPNIDGGLVGGASLKPEFAAIVQTAGV
ncbi:MAG: triose-phosphate isomerase [Clostridiales bacterium]|jgi:triosephosphate isomerase|nr:triose-phosphate isomerase [Clostridiales bacterium]